MKRQTHGPTAPTDTPTSSLCGDSLYTGPLALGADIFEEQVREFESPFSQQKSAFYYQ